MNMKTHDDLSLDEKSPLSHPRTPMQYLRIYLTGFAMGCADLVPGVSGGTMAFILGIYETLLDAIKSFNLDAVRLGLKFDIRGLLEHIPYRFILALGLGLATAVLALSNALHNALENQPTFIFAFFAGLIIASIIAIGVKVKWALPSIASFLIATIFAFWLTGLPLLEDAGHSAPVLFGSGAIAICAMVLPGISGSFILLILGQYEFIIAAIKDLDILPLIPFGLGVVVGIISFSRVISWLLKHHEHVTVAALTGFMLGSLRMIWAEASNGVSVVSETGVLSTGQIVLVIVLMIGGFLLVSFLDHLQARSNPVFALVWKPRPQIDDIAEKAAALD